MKIKSQRDFWSGLLFVAAGLGFAWGATFYRLGDSARPGPGFFPLGLGLLTALLGLVILFKALSVERADGDPIGRIAWKPLGFIVGAVVLFGWAVPHLGLLLALPLLVIVSALAGDEFRWREVLVNSIVLTALSWAIFIWGLGLTMPLLPAPGGT
jgi:hypothetical protein